jgi:membrane protein implicated in regulation of membrane protease activity
MGRIVFILFNLVLLAAALMTGAVFFVIFAAILAGIFLFLYIRLKLTGRLPGNMRFYRFEQRVREETSTPDTQVIEAEYEEVEK